jgi:hypothetical protein
VSDRLLRAAERERYGTVRDAERERDGHPLGPSGSYDPARVKRGQRSGRETGCWVYIPAAVLEAARMPLDGPAPSYRVWHGQGRGSVLVRLYLP